MRYYYTYSYTSPYSNCAIRADNATLASVGAHVSYNQPIRVNAKSNLGNFMFIVGNTSLALYDLDNNRQVGHIPYLEIGTDLVVRKTFTYNYSVNPGEIVSITGNNFNISAPSGYSFFALRGFDSGSISGGLLPFAVKFDTGSGVVMKIRNINSSGGASSATATVIFEFIKSQFDGGTV